MIVALDPGGTTGLAGLDGPTFWTAQLGPMEACDWLWANQARLTALVIESFVITQQTIRKARERAPMDVIGFVVWLAHHLGVPLTFQTPAEAKRFGTDEKLARVGWRVPGDHARDAARHLLLYGVKTGTINAKDVLHGKGNPQG